MPRSQSRWTGKTVFTAKRISTRFVGGRGSAEIAAPPHERTQADAIASQIAAWQNSCRALRRVARERFGSPGCPLPIGVYPNVAGRDPGV